MQTTDRETTIVVEVATLGHWATAWDDLASRSPLPSPFLRTWWLEATGNGRSHYVLVVDGDTLIGGLALERRRLLGVVDHFGVLSGGKLCPDHIDMLAMAGRAEDTVRALRDWFTAPGSRIIDLEGVVDGGARVIDAIAPASVSGLDVARYERLPSSMAEYYRARSKTFGPRVRRFQRRSVASGVSYRRITATEVPAAMVEFSAMHAARDDRQKLVQQMPRITRAVELGVARGEVRIYVAEKDGRCGAVLLLFTTGGRISIYQTARWLEHGFNHVGTIITLVAISDACEEGMTELDFLRGAEPYKASFASSRRQLLRVQAAHGSAGQIGLRLPIVGAALRRWLGAGLGQLRRSKASR